jgi:hypothetical protein
MLLNTTLHICTSILPNATSILPNATNATKVQCYKDLNATNTTKATRGNLEMLEAGRV